MLSEAEALESLSKKELLSMLKFGADRIFANAEGKPPTDAELDALIDRSAKVAATAGAAPFTSSPRLCSKYMYL